MNFYSRNKKYFKQIWIYFSRVILFLILTLLTQVGGVIYLINRVCYKFIERKIQHRFLQRLTKFSSFLIIYLLCTFFIVPVLAKPFGKVPLPMTESHSLQPKTILTVLLNRNYVRSEFRDAAFSVGDKMNAKYPGTVLNYLDANFPFFNNFPLFPHVGHNDGKKLDLSFCYNERKTGTPTNRVPASLGYGVCEEPMENEFNMPDDCEQKGYWKYSFMKKMVSQSNKADFTLNEEKTADLITFFAEEPLITKIFIEPHLVKRLNLQQSKIKFHGCHAVRHDDHIHVEMK